jgi:hypothetical protein
MHIEQKCMKYSCMPSVAPDTVTGTQVAMCLLSNRRIVVHELTSKFRIKLDLLQVQSTHLAFSILSTQWVLKPWST